MRRAYCLVIALLFVSVAISHAATCAPIQSAKNNTYGFRPSRLNDSERKTKSAAMDRFWDLAKSSGPEGIECLKQLLLAEKDDKYFLFDAASLLASLDSSGGSDTAILRGLSRTDLQDVQVDAFIALALQLSHRNVDIGPAARNYLHAQNVTVYLARHGGYKLGRVEGSILLYGSMEPASVDKYLSQEVRSADAETRDTAAIVWSMNLTGESFRGLAALGKMKDFSEGARQATQGVRKSRDVAVTRPPKYTRDQMLRKVSRFPDIDPNIDEAEDKALDNSIYATFKQDDLDALREGRRRMIQGVSNESVEGYGEISRIILNLINVLDIYKEYRVR